MVSRTKLLLGAVGLVGLGVATRRYVQDRTTPRVDYETVARVGDVAVRRYPPAVVVETVAPSETVAFRRLFRYISGENRSATEVSMTAPVESARADEAAAATAQEESETVPMTAPVESERSDGGVRMAFYLPAGYDFDSAPRPTDDAVRLVERPGQTVAVLGFSWWATEGRVARKTDELRATLAAADGEYEEVGDPFLLRYEGPWVPPFLRTNEVGVAVRRASSA
ncbi:MAG: heme-binding protein [Haloplanus sp.]